MHNIAAVLNLVSRSVALQPKKCFNCLKIFQSMNAFKATFSRIKSRTVLLTGNTASRGWPQLFLEPDDVLSVCNFF